MLSALAWTVGSGEGPIVPVVLGVLTGSIRSHFNLPEVLIFPTFRLLLKSRTAGDITVKLRFGFTDADADVATLGIDFALLATAVSSDTRSAVWLNGGVAPNFVGNSNSILPPRVSVQLTTNNPAGFSGSYAVYYSGIIIP